MAPKVIFLIFSGSKKEEPRYTCLSEAKAVYQPHQVKVSSQGIMSGKKTRDHPGLYPVEG
jgi:hypothetical protein